MKKQRRTQGLHTSRATSLYGRESRIDWMIDLVLYLRRVLAVCIVGIRAFDAHL
jgi:hypothetical protein